MIIHFSPNYDFAVVYSHDWQDIFARYEIDCLLEKKSLIAFNAIRILLASKGRDICFFFVENPILVSRFFF